jgi:hypothetical protein
MNAGQLPDHLRPTAADTVRPRRDWRCYDQPIGLHCDNSNCLAVPDGAHIVLAFGIDEWVNVAIAYAGCQRAGQSLLLSRLSSARSTLSS